MLNELHELRQALANAEIATTISHPDVKSVTRSALRVQLDNNGVVKQVFPLDPEQAKRLWTLRDGQHNSFPYHQLKNPLLRVDDPDDGRLVTIRDGRAEEGDRWAALLSLANEAPFNAVKFEGWPGKGYLRRLIERRVQVSSLCGTPAAAVPAAFDRFMCASEHAEELLRSIAQMVTERVHQGRIATDLPLIAQLLVEEKGGGSLYFDVTRDFLRLAGDERNITEIGRALTAETSGVPDGVCSITGEDGFLVADKFPQPNLPILGQTYLFARNKDAPTNARYGRAGMKSIAVGSNTASALQSAVEKLTQPEWEGRTWRGVSGERPKQRDLLVAFVDGIEDIPFAKVLTTDGESPPGAEGRFISFAEQLTQAFGGRVQERQSMPLSLFVLRKLDPANRKVVYAGQLDVSGVLSAARRWSAGCGNTPPSIRLPIPGERGQPVRLLPPWDVSPLSLPWLTRQYFIRGGTERQEIAGITANEAMRLFLAPEHAATPSIHLLLRRTLRCRGGLLESVGEAQARGFDQLMVFDRREALNTITILGLLLYRLGRTREKYMNDAAYMLGQLLAGADALHAAYNASERSGSALPPRLIGNAVLPMAQANPRKALSVLGRRWAVYEGWAMRKGGQWSFPDRFKQKRRGDVDKKDLAEYDQSQAIVRGLSASRRLRPLAGRLVSALDADLVMNDKFRSELLLGYIAGPPRPEAEGDHNNSNTEKTNGDL